MVTVLVVVLGRACAELLGVDAAGAYCSGAGSQTAGVVGGSSGPGGVISRLASRPVREKAEGVVAAAKDVDLKLPLVVRLEGTNVELGKKVLEESGLDIVSAQDLGDAARKIVDAIGEAN